MYMELLKALERLAGDIYMTQMNLASPNSHILPRVSGHLNLWLFQKQFFKP